MCLDVCFVGLNGFLILCRRIGAGVSQQQVIMPNGYVDVPASNLADVGPILGIRVADGDRYDKSHLLRVVHRISVAEEVRYAKREKRAGELASTMWEGAATR
jgi:hypothetical protein